MSESDPSCLILNFFWCVWYHWLVLYSGGLRVMWRVVFVLRDRSILVWAYLLVPAAVFVLACDHRPDIVCQGLLLG